MMSMFQPQSYQQISAQKKDSTILFCTGLGINQSPQLPVRFFAYLLPLLVAVNTFPNSKGQFYIADQAAVRLGYDSKIVEHNTVTLQNVIPLFINYFYPHLNQRIFITTEISLEEAEIKEKRQELIEQFIKEITETKHPAIHRFAHKKSTAGDIKPALQYMVEHTLFMRDPITPDSRLFLVKNPDNFSFETLMMIGGPSEKIFYTVRKILLYKYHTTHFPFKTIQLFTDVGRIPPYYTRFNEPVITEEITEEVAQVFLSTIHAELLTDYKILLNLCAKPITQPLPQTILLKNNASLQQGFDNLKGFLKVVSQGRCYAREFTTDR